MQVSDIARGIVVALVGGALILVLNRSLGAEAAFDEDARRAVAGGLIAGGFVAFYMPLRRRIRNMIGNRTS